MTQVPVLTCVGHFVSLDLAGIAEALGAEIALVLQLPGVPLLVRTQRRRGAVGLVAVATRKFTVFRGKHFWRFRIRYSRRLRLSNVRYCGRRSHSLRSHDCSAQLLFLHDNVPEIKRTINKDIASWRGSAIQTKKV
jgi:hypothetical protein